MHRLSVAWVLVYVCYSAHTRTTDVYHVSGVVQVGNPESFVVGRSLDPKVHQGRTKASMTTS